MRVNDAIVEKFVDSNIQMGKLLAVHDEKLDKQDRIDAVLFEKVEHLHKIYMPMLHLLEKITLMILRQ